MSVIGYSSQLICNNRAELLRGAVMSMDYPSRVLRFESIFDGTHERSGTFFVDGVITPPIVSVQCRIPSFNSNAESRFAFFDDVKLHNLLADDTGLYDPQTEDADLILTNLNDSVSVLANMDIEVVFRALISKPYTLLAACTKLNMLPEYCLLWQNVDLVNRKFRPNTKVSILNFQPK